MATAVTSIYSYILAKHGHNCTENHHISKKTIRLVSTDALCMVKWVILLCGESSLLGYDAVWNGQLLVLRSSLLSPYSRVRTSWDLRMGTTYVNNCLSVEWRHIPEELNLQQYHCLNLVIRPTPLITQLRLDTVAYRGGRDSGVGVKTPSEIRKFWQSWAEFPVPWNILP
jgi:hypothetical protein